MKVRILGAGVAGLASALALVRRAGIDDVVVYESDPVFNAADRRGHGLILMQNGVETLQALGAAQVLDGCTALERAVFQDRRGMAVHTDALQDVFCVTRAALIEGLRRELSGDPLRLGRHVQAIDLDWTQATPRVRAVRFSDGEVLVVDEDTLVIGADGVGSALCLALNPGLQRPISQVLEIVTSSRLPDLAAQLGPVFVKTVLPERGLAFGLLAPSPERVIGFLQFDSRRHPVPVRGEGPEALRKLVVSLMVDAPDPVAAYLERADFRSAHLWRPIDAPLPQRLHATNAVLVGDAAHPVLPFTSQGVSAALEDAIVLADRLHLDAEVRTPLVATLAAFASARADDVRVYVEGGQRILANFVDDRRRFVVPYVDGAASRLEAHLNLPEETVYGLFRVLDGDADGRLGRVELADALDLLGVESLAEAVDTLFDEIDVDGNGLLDPGEVVAALGADPARERPRSAALRSLRRQLSPHKVKLLTVHGRAQRLFEQLDRDSDGSITRLELGEGLAVLGLIRPTEAIDRLFAELDRDGNGAVDLDEIVAALMAPVPGSLLAELSARSLEETTPDPLFGDDRVDRTVLRQRAYNFRWAVHEPDVIPLTAADPDFQAAPVIIEALQRYTRAGYFSYGPAEGLPELREAAARRLTERFGLPTSPERVLVTNSAASALYLVASLVFDEPGQASLIADPVDFLFERSAASVGAELQRYAIHADAGLSFDPAEIEAKITPRTRLLTVCNPHNPLGRVWRREELMALAELAVRHDLWIMSDEVWADIVYAPGVHIPIASLAPEIARRTFTIYGFSKGFCLAGLRLGLLVCPDDAQLRRAVECSHADETAYGVPTLSQIAGVAAYNEAEHWLQRFVRHLQRQRDHVVARLDALPGVHCHAPEGTFVAFPDISAIAKGRDEAEIVERLRAEHRVAVVPGSPRFFGPGAAGHLRISFATSRAILDEGLDRLSAGLAALIR